MRGALSGQPSEPEDNGLSSISFLSRLLRIGVVLRQTDYRIFSLEDYQ